MSIYDYDEEDVRRTLFEEAKEMAKRRIKRNSYRRIKTRSKKKN